MFSTNLTKSEIPFHCVDVCVRSCRTVTMILQIMIAKFCEQKATKRPQIIGLKATAAKRLHFAHGCFKAYKIFGKALDFSNFELQLKCCTIPMN